MSDDDGIISGYLARQDPAEFEAFMDACGKALTDAMPAAYRRLRGLPVFVADDVIGDAFERALKHLRAQFLRHKGGFRFDPAFGLTFEQWFLQVVGYPGRGGVAGTELNKAIRERDRQAPLDDALQIAQVPKQDKDHLDALDRALARLEGRPQFVVRAQYGVHNAGTLDADGIGRLAVMVRLSTPKRRLLRHRADILIAQGLRPSRVLKPRDIGHLLEIGERQVCYIKASALKTLRREGLGGIAESLQ